MNTESPQSIETAIFPIPETVALPGSALQLHVFEPRYRQMIVDCIERSRSLAVACGSPHRHGHARPGKPQPLREILSTNQETYVPAPVFGVGNVGILARLPDGRFLVEVSIRHRARFVEYVQEVPYLVARCDILPPDATDDPASRQLFDGLMLAADTLLGDKARIFRNQLGAEVVDERRLDLLVYPILQWFQVGASATQALLEEETDFERGSRLLAWMSRYLEVARAQQPREAEEPAKQKQEAEDYEATILPFRSPRQHPDELPEP